MNAWRARAACAGQVPDVWFLPETEKEAIRICHGCPVRAECLADALTHEGAAETGRYGIRGGLTPVQRSGRSQAKKTRDGVPVPPDCDTPTRHGARRHRANCEPACAGCLACEREYLQAQRARARTA